MPNVGPTHPNVCRFICHEPCADYTVSLRGLEGQERKNQLLLCHERGANRLLDLCFANGGVYIKVAQHIGQLDHMLPSEYVTKMREHALDKVRFPNLHISFSARRAVCRSLNTRVSLNRPCLGTKLFDIQSNTFQQNLLSVRLQTIPNSRNIQHSTVENY